MEGELRSRLTRGPKSLISNHISMNERRTIDRALASYTIAAGAVLASSAAANAGIVYSGAKNISVGSVGFADYSVDLDGNGSNDFRFWLYNPSMGGPYLYLSCPSANAVAFPQGSFNAPARLDKGATIGSGTNLGWVVQSNMKLNSGAGFLGNFNNESGYIGVQFSDSGFAPHYGWIQFAGELGSGTIIDCAYESDVDTPIRPALCPSRPRPGLRWVCSRWAPPASAACAGRRLSADGKEEEVDPHPGGMQSD